MKMLYWSAEREYGLISHFDQVRVLPMPVGVWGMASRSSRFDKDREDVLIPHSSPL